MVRLGINVESAAVMRKLRKNPEPDPVVFAVLAELGGCDGIVCPLREGFVFLTERDARLLKDTVKTHFNLQIPPLGSLVSLALSLNPDMITFAATTGGDQPYSAPVDVFGMEDDLASMVGDIRSADGVVSFVIDPAIDQIKAAAQIGVDYVELHTGAYAAADDFSQRTECLDALSSAALAASKIGLGVAAGGGLSLPNLDELLAIERLEEVNIGHALFARAMSLGMERAVRDVIALVRAKNH